jgi:hypothetical protein
VLLLRATKQAAPAVANAVRKMRTSLFICCSGWCLTRMLQTGRSHW